MPWTPRLPALAAIEANLRARQRTAALGALFAVVGLQSMVGLMVTKAGYGWKKNRFGKGSVIHLHLNEHDIIICVYT